jgi:hypothetical protein
MKQSIGDFLLRRLQEVGVRHIFGVPGDYNLELLQQLQDAGTLELGLLRRSRPITNSSNKGADLDYGLRGPQHRDNQLRPIAH